jgi:two-component sensor histidine kinase
MMEKMNIEQVVMCSFSRIIPDAMTHDDPVKNTKDHVSTLQKLIRCRLIKLHHRRPFIIIEYSVYSFINIMTWFIRLNSMKSAIKFKFHSIAHHLVAPVFRVVFIILACMTTVCGQPEINYRKVKNTEEISAKYEPDKSGLHYNSANNQSQQNNTRGAGINKIIILTGGALLLIIIVLSLHLYLTKRNNNLSLRARQRELDQKNAMIETQNDNQERLLKEKEWLIKEVQHRVKNNLQMVTSLLYSQSVYLEDDAAIQAIKDSLRRMQAMSLIHQKLYQDNDTSTISMPEYINDLVKYLHESFDADNHIVFEQSIVPVALDVSQVIPLGLIFTESIVNAIKYAFLQGQQGIVRLWLGHDGPEHLLLKISDNGMGLPAGIDAKEHNSFGLDLIQGLSKQLKGSFRIENNNGVHITVRFAISQ